jgi:hypothetical protein
VLTIYHHAVLLFALTRSPRSTSDALSFPGIRSNTILRSSLRHCWRSVVLELSFSLCARQTWALWPVIDYSEATHLFIRAHLPACSYEMTNCSTPRNFCIHQYTHDPIVDSLKFGSTRAIRYYFDLVTGACLELFHLFQTGNSIEVGIAQTS